MMIFMRVFYWVYLDISGSLEETPTIATVIPSTPATSAISNSTDVQTVSGCQPLDGAEMSPITISRLYQSTEFYGDHSVFKKRKNTGQNLPAVINKELEPHFLGETSTEGKLSFVFLVANSHSSNSSSSSLTHSLTQSVPKYVKPSEPIKWAFVCF